MIPLVQADLNTILDRALSDPERGYGGKVIQLDPDARQHLIGLANGDARNLLNALELAVESTLPEKDGVIHLTLEVAEESIQRRAVVYDKNGDAHYDTISAFIKSVRGSDPDGAIYWLAKMLAAGEEPRFVLRRLIVLAGEDIGLADPQALVVATAAATAFEYIGMPEGIYPIAEATLYLATAPKSNSAGAVFRAQKYIDEHGLGAVPTHLMDSNRDSRGLGHGQGYQYPHEFPGHFVAQQYLPRDVQGTIFYKPSDQGYEKQILERLEKWRKEQSDGLKAAAEKNASNPSDPARG
jgi:putative ATPase